MEKQDAPLLISVVEAARRLALGKTKVYELIASGDFPAVKVGRKMVRVDPNDLLGWIDRHRVS
jgi:excisionase family DNA binding protein